MKFPDKLRKLLDDHRLSQKEFGESIGTYQQTVSRWLESGKPPGPEYLLRIARALGVTVDYLIDDEQQDAESAMNASVEQQYIVRTVRAFGLSFEEAIRRLAGNGPQEPGK